MSSVITISSIRGGVGKSSLSLEMTKLLSTKGKVLLIDTDFYGPTQFHEINSRSKKPIEKPEGFFRDNLKGMCPYEKSIVDISDNLKVIFSDPNVNLWELSTDVGSRNFWIDENPDKRSPAETGLDQLRTFVKDRSYDYIVFDTMAGFAYPVVFFSYISKTPIFLARPSLPQIDDAIGYVNILGTKERKVNVIWSNVPNTNDYMEKTRKDLNNQLKKKSQGNYRILGYIPRDPELEQGALLGTLTMVPGKKESLYHDKLGSIANDLLELL